MIEELESKLRHDMPQEPPIFTTSLPPLLMSRSNLQLLKERENNIDNVRDASSIEPSAETGAVVVAANNDKMALVAARNNDKDFITTKCELQRDESLSDGEVSDNPLPPSKREPRQPRKSRQTYFRLYKALLGINYHII
jgi:hypothetical protein